MRFAAGPGVQYSEKVSLVRIAFSLYIPGMNTPKAIKILKRCEAELKELLTEAASSGDYDCLLRATEWARYDKM